MGLSKISYTEAGGVLVPNRVQALGKLLRVPAAGGGAPSEPPEPVIIPFGDLDQPSSGEAGSFVFEDGWSTNGGADTGTIKVTVTVNFTLVASAWQGQVTLTPAFVVEGTGALFDQSKFTYNWDFQKPYPGGSVTNNISFGNTRQEHLQYLTTWAVRLHVSDFGYQLDTNWDQRTAWFEITGATSVD